MKTKNQKTNLRGLLLASACLTSAVPALAQTQVEEGDDQVADDNVIVVTGTLLRGIAPTGTNVIGLAPSDITSTGAANTKDLLATIPQTGAFNDPPQISAGTNTQSSNNRPRIRNIGSPFAGGSATLVLLDGHRVVGSGIRQTTPDPDIVPPGVIERIEIIPDGGSSTYGADAVAGVINFISRRRFSGIEADARYGLGDDYQMFDANFTAGHAWDTGSIYASYNYAWNDEVLGGDRDYIQRLDWTAGVPADRNCNPGNITIRPVAGGAITYALPARVPNTLNRCDESDFATFFPEDERHSLFAGLSQDFGDNVRVDIRGFYTHRESLSNQGPYRSSSATITPANPFYVDIPGAATSGRPQVVAFSWEPVFGTQSLRFSSELETWGITPTIDIDLSDNWQLRGLFNYGESRTELNNASLNPTLLNASLAGTTPQTAINPYDIAATPNRQLLNDITNWQFFGESKQKLVNARAIVDGSLFLLPGGEVRAAFGTEYIREEFASRTGDIVPGTQNTLPFVDANRDVYSAFGELFVPIFGSDNRTDGFHSLALSLSARYDDYSDFGDTFNPKIGLTYQPVDWFTIRGNWGTSFQAPSLADSQAAINTLSIFPFPIIPNPFQPPVAGDQPFIALQGGFPGLRPQEAETYSIGAEVTPTALPGLRASLTYYNIDFRDLIDIPPLGDAQLFYGFFTDFFIMNPTQAEVEALAATIPGGLARVQGADLFAPGKPDVYTIVDIRRTNLSRVKLDGLDFSISYESDTSFGSVDFSFAGTYELNRKTQGVPTLPFTDDLDTGTSRFRSVATAGADIGNLRAQLSWYHTAGFDLIPLAANDFQEHVDAFDVFDLFLRYDFEGEGVFNDLSLTLNVDNLFDADPPQWRSFDFVTAGFLNGSTIGRVVQFGIRKKF